MARSAKRAEMEQASLSLSKMWARAFILALCLGAAILLGAQRGNSSQKASSYPVWWYQDLDLYNVRDIPTRFARPFTPRQERFLVEELARYGNDSSSPPKTCEALLHESESIEFADSSDWNSQHTNTWGSLGVQCSLLAALRDARPARASFLYNLSWNQGISNLLPASVAWTNNGFMVEEALKADKQKKSLRQFRPKSKWTADSSTLEEQDQDESDPGYGAFYNIAARGDFNGDGLEDWIIEATGALHRTGDRSYDSFLVTKRSAAGRIELLKRLY